MNTTQITAGTRFQFAGNMGCDGFSGRVTKVEDGWFWYVTDAGRVSAAPSPVALFNTPGWKVVLDLGNNEIVSRGVFPQADGTVLAMTFSRSKTFKTRGSAERWLAR